MSENGFIDNNKALGIKRIDFKLYEIKINKNYFLKVN